MKRVAYCLCLCVLLSNVGCKTKEKEAGPSSGAKPDPAPPPSIADHGVKDAPSPAPPGDSDPNHVVLTASDSMQFDKKLITVKAGKQVTLELKHSGKLAAQVMGHNFVLLKQGVVLASFAQEAMAAQATEYIPKGDSVIAHTKLIGGGESTSIVFDAPPAGTYDFLCTFPGHYVLMQGKFVVE